MLLGGQHFYANIRSCDANFPGEMVRVRLREANSIVMLACLFSPAVPHCHLALLRCSAKATVRVRLAHRAQMDSDPARLSGHLMCDSESEAA